MVRRNLRTQVFLFVHLDSHKNSRLTSAVLCPYTAARSALPTVKMQHGAASLRSSPVCTVRASPSHSQPFIRHLFPSLHCTHLFTYFPVHVRAPASLRRKGTICTLNMDESTIIVENPAQALAAQKNLCRSESRILKYTAYHVTVFAHFLYCPCM